MFKERLIISILLTTVITTSFHSNWLQFIQVNAKKTYMRQAFAINNSTFHQKIKATKMSANGSFGSVQRTVPQNGCYRWWDSRFSFRFDLVKRWLTRRKIIIDEDTTEFDFYLKKLEILSIVRDPLIPVIEPPYSFIRYIGTRIKVKNDGSSTAEGCKATLITHETELRVGWMIPYQDCTVTINAHDVEYLDLCAISEDDTNRVCTTERGYGDYVHSGRRLNGSVIDAKLKVSAKNAK